MNDCVLALSAPGESPVSERPASPAGVGGPRCQGGGVATHRARLTGMGKWGALLPRLPAPPCRRAGPFALHLITFSKDEEFRNMVEYLENPDKQKEKAKNGA